MDAPERGALMLVRFIAVALVCAGVLEFALYWVNNSVHQLPARMVPCIIKSFPVLIGIIMLIRSKSLARWISDKLDL